jgi:hypothetical protein
MCWIVLFVKLESIQLHWELFIPNPVWCAALENMLLVLVLLLKATVLFALQGCIHLELEPQLAIIANWLAKPLISFSHAHQRLMDTAHLFTVPLIIFKRVHHVVCATVLDVRLDLIEGRVLPVQIPSVCHAPTSQAATIPCMYQQANQQMQTIASGSVNLFATNAVRWLFVAVLLSCLLRIIPNL